MWQKFPSGLPSGLLETSLVCPACHRLLLMENINPLPSTFPAQLFNFRAEEILTILCQKSSGYQLVMEHINPISSTLPAHLSYSQCSKYWPFQCWGYFHTKHKNAKIFENHLNSVMLVFIGKLSLSTFRCVSICHGFIHFSGFLLHFVLVKSAVSANPFVPKMVRLSIFDGKCHTSTLHPSCPSCHFSAQNINPIMSKMVRLSIDIGKYQPSGPSTLPPSFPFQCSKY